MHSLGLPSTLTGLTHSLLRQLLVEIRVCFLDPLESLHGGSPQAHILCCFGNCQPCFCPRGAPRGRARLYVASLIALRRSSVFAHSLLRLFAIKGKDSKRDGSPLGNRQMPPPNVDRHDEADSRRQPTSSDCDVESASDGRLKMA